MHLLVILNNLDFGGMQKWFLEIGRYLAAKGWVITFAYASEGGYGMTWANEFSKIGVILPLPDDAKLKRLYSPVSFLKSAARLRGYIRDQKVTVIYSASSWSTYLAIITRKLTGIPIVNTPGSNWYTTGVCRKLYSLGLNPYRCDCYTAIGPHQVRTYERLNIAKDRILEIQLGTNLERFQPVASIRSEMRDTLGFSPTDIVLGFVGRLHPAHALDTVIETLGRLRAESLNRYRYLLVGDGQFRNELKQWAISQGVEGSVHFAGYQSATERYYQAMDFAVTYMNFQHENDPNIGTMTVEAMASGVPVLHFNPDWLCEGYEEDVSGHFIDFAGNPDKLSSVLRAIHRRQDFTSMRNAARSLAVERFNISDMLEKIEKRLWRMIRRT
jgi:glycosyltransferase involved in cell wall biosynthesis